MNDPSDCLALVQLWFFNTKALLADRITENHPMNSVESITHLLCITLKQLNMDMSCLHILPPPSKELQVVYTQQTLSPFKTTLCGLGGDVR